MFLLLGAALLVTTLAVAQDTPSADPSPNSQSSKTDQTSSSVIRGCLSGSAGNYTITDQNGMQYTIAGPDNQLAARVGHEVEITTHQDQTSESTSQGDQATARSTNSVQVSDVRDVASTCKAGNSSGSAPMNDKAVPKGATSTSEPPQTMAMLQEQTTPPAGAQEQKPGTTPPQQTTPPVSSQTPATPASSTETNPQTGSSPASTTSTNGAAGSSVNQGATNSPTTDPNAVPASPNAATPPATQPPPPTADDANKPLYERQATDIPWANHSKDTNGSANPPH
jgi:hypothetical protein